MSFNKISNVIEEFDTVLIYINYNKIIWIEARAHIKNKHGKFINNIVQTQFGVLKGRDLIGKEYGSSLRLNSGCVYLLKPSSVLWTEALNHRTQIIYPPDISMIVYQLEISNGKIILESGTGSAALSHSFIRACRPAGHLHTFEVSADRFEQAQREFERHALTDFVTIYHKNVYENGFGEQFHNTADAIFLDLPEPHRVVPYAVDCFKRNEATRFCSFSPCIEQVQKTCQALEEYGFTEIQTMEIIPFYYTVTTKSFPKFSIETETADDAEDCSSANKKRKLDVETEPETSLVKKSEKLTHTEYVSSTLPLEINSHTGYLTFATMLPIWARNICLESNDNETNSIAV